MHPDRENHIEEGYDLVLARSGRCRATTKKNRIKAARRQKITLGAFKKDCVLWYVTYYWSVLRW